MSRDHRPWVHLKWPGLPVVLVSPFAVTYQVVLVSSVAVTYQVVLVSPVAVIYQVVLVSPFAVTYQERIKPQNRTFVSNTTFIIVTVKQI